MITNALVYNEQTSLNWFRPLICAPGLEFQDLLWYNISVNQNPLRGSFRMGQDFHCYVKEYDLYSEVSCFKCCGDEDLYPFKCSECLHLMVFCYECSTLYKDLEYSTKRDLHVNPHTPDRPAFLCPRCNFSFEYYFMKNELYFATYQEWIRGGQGRLLNRFVHNPPHPVSIKNREDNLYLIELEWCGDEIVAQSFTDEHNWLSWLKQISNMSEGAVKFAYDSSKISEDFNVNTMSVVAREPDEHLSSLFHYSLIQEYQKRQKNRKPAKIWNPVLLNYI